MMSENLYNNMRIKRHKLCNLNKTGSKKRTYFFTVSIFVYIIVHCLFIMKLEIIVEK